MFLKSVTKSSVILSSSDVDRRQAIAATVKRLAGAYEVDMSVLKGITSAEIFFDTNIPGAERRCLVGEILDTFERELAAVHTS